MINTIKRARIKFLKYVVAKFPSNSIRVKALRKIGFEVGKDVYVANNLTIAYPNSKVDYKLRIGDRVAIAPNVTFVLSSHSNWSKLREIYPEETGDIWIKDDCWLGAGTIFLPNVTVGESSIVASGAVVNKDVEPWTIVGGVPAKKIKSISK